jgi:DNA methylase
VVTISGKVTANSIALNGTGLKSLREDNKLRPEDRPAHDWYRFVLSFPPHLVRDIIQRFGVGPPQRALDPFCGTGTTLVECKKLGIPSVGVEANPMACFARRVKVDWDVDPDGLLEHAHGIAARALQQLEAEGIEDHEEPPLFRKPRVTDTQLHTVSADAWKLLLKNSISPLPLHKVLTLARTLRDQWDDRFSRHEQLALAKAIVFGASNLEFGPEVGVGPLDRDGTVADSAERDQGSNAEIYPD